MIRFSSFLFAFVFMLCSAAHHAAQAQIADTVEALAEKSMGNENAPVTIIEYASLTCGHCAKFHKEDLPQLEKEYIDTGKVRLILRDFPLDQYALKAAAIARCAGNDRYFAFLKVLFDKQGVWLTEENPLVGLERIARVGGLSSEDFRVCLKNEAIEKGILQSRLDADKQFKINSTPTFIIDGKKYDGDHSFASIKKVLDKKLSGVSEEDLAPAAESAPASTEAPGFFAGIKNFFRNLFSGS